MLLPVVTAESLSVTEPAVLDVTSALANSRAPQGAAHCLRHTPGFSIPSLDSLVAKRHDQWSSVTSEQLH